MNMAEHAKSWQMLGSTAGSDKRWGTRDSAQARSYRKKFGSVTVLNGHIHQTMQEVEGNVTFHTAASAAFPQPAPGKADSPGPMKVPPEQLKSILGITDVNYVRGQHALHTTPSTDPDKRDSRIRLLP